MDALRELEEIGYQWMTETKPTKFVPKGEIVRYIHPQNLILTYGYLENLHEVDVGMQPKII